MLERSANRVDWSFVAEWSNPDPAPPGDQTFNLEAASLRPPPEPPRVVSWNPAAVSCEDCSKRSVHGIEANAALEVTFSERIHLGFGIVKVERGQLGDVLLDASRGDWLQVLENRLRIAPQGPLGASSSCSAVRFEAGALQDSNGEFFAQGVPYTICIADTVPPKLQRTQPPDGSANQGLSPRILLEFDEEVLVLFSPPPAQLIPLDSATAETVTIDMRDTSQVQVTSCTYCRIKGVVEIGVPGQLEPETGYRLRVPAGAIGDVRGNTWPGYEMTFATECGPLGCAGTPAPTRTTPSPESGEETSQESLPVALYLGIVAAALCCGLVILASFKKYVRRYVLPWKRDSGAQAAKVTQLPPGPNPDWVAKSGAATSGWRRPASLGGNTGPSPGGGSAVGPAGGGGHSGSQSPGSPSSGSWGTSVPHASRVTAATPNGGPRVAAWASPSAEAPRHSHRASTLGGAAPPHMPPEPATQKRRAQTEEDLKNRPTSAGMFAAAGAKKSFTEDNAVSGGWVRATDSASGRTYWYHYKTRETRWDEPPHSGASAAAPKPRAAPEPSRTASPDQKPKGQGAPKPEAPRAAPRAEAGSSSARQESRAPPPAAKAPKPAPPPVPNTKAKGVCTEIQSQLDKTRKEDLASRKKSFRFLCLQWHPDKNQEDVELATEVFQFLQQQRDWYLKE